jgi:hypothetical protein
MLFKYRDSFINKQTEVCIGLQKADISRIKNGEFQSLRNEVFEKWAYLLSVRLSVCPPAPLQQLQDQLNYFMNSEFWTF